MLNVLLIHNSDFLITEKHWNYKTAVKVYNSNTFTEFKIRNIWLTIASMANNLAVNVLYKLPHL